MAEDFLQDFTGAEIADLLTAVEAGVPSDLAMGVIRAARSEEGDRGEGRRRDWLKATAAALRLGVERSRVLPMLDLPSEAKADIDRAIRGGLDADLAVQIALQVPDDRGRRRDLMEDAFTARRAGLGEEVVEDSVERAQGRRKSLRRILNARARQAGIGRRRRRRRGLPRILGFRFRTPFPFRTLADVIQEQEEQEEQEEREERSWFPLRRRRRRRRRGPMFLGLPFRIPTPFRTLDDVVREQWEREEREERERSGPPGEIDLNRLIDFITEVVFRRVVERMRVE